MWDDASEVPMPEIPVVYPPGPAKRRYTVSAYDRWEYPDADSYDHRGEFDSAAEAIACANRVVRKSLEHLRRQKPNADADELLAQYHHFGEVPVIRGEPRVPFDTRTAVAWHIRQMTRGFADAP
jgi:hypothetical protein